MVTTPKKLERDQGNAVVAGVLAGLANYYKQDPVLFRVVAITFLILTGVFPGILIYIMAVLIMPKKPLASADVQYEVVD